MMVLILFALIWSVRWMVRQGRRHRLPAPRQQTVTALTPVRQQTIDHGELVRQFRQQQLAAQEWTRLEIERQRQAERDRKAEQERDLAAADAERYQAQKITLVRLLDSIEAELATTTDQRRITTLLSKQVSVENKLYTIDSKIDRAYMMARSY